MRGHCLLVPGDSGVILHPQGGEALNFLPISICCCSWRHFGLSVGTSIASSLCHFASPQLTCPLHLVQFPSGTFFHSPCHSSPHPHCTSRHTGHSAGGHRRFPSWCWCGGESSRGQLPLGLRFLSSPTFKCCPCHSVGSVDNSILLVASCGSPSHPHSCQISDTTIHFSLPKTLKTHDVTCCHFPPAPLAD